DDRPHDERGPWQDSLLGIVDFHELDFPADVRARHGWHASPNGGRWHTVFNGRCSKEWFELDWRSSLGRGSNTPIHPLVLGLPRHRPTSVHLELFLEHKTRQAGRI